MDLFSIVNEIEQQSIAVNLARTVLLEAVRYVQRTDIEPTIIIHNLPTITNLIVVANDYLCKTEQGLDALTKHISSVFFNRTRGDIKDETNIRER